MSWKELRDFYKVNPSRWFFGKTGEYQDFNHLYYIVKPKKWYVVNISMFSYFRLLWSYHFGNPMTEDKEIVFECVQSDIDEIKAKAQRELEEANAMMEEVKNRLERGKS
ncbi:MAG: hypothetical protein K2N48_01655 [Muribaculaceae bacterium]|nr:hypothetical protein [Muribaculaceae bacterium]